MKLCLAVLVLLLCGCTSLTVEEQARQAKVCHDGGLGTEFTMNLYTMAVDSVHCTVAVDKK